MLPAEPARSAGSRRPASAPATVSTPTTTREHNSEACSAHGDRPPPDPSPPRPNRCCAGVTHRCHPRRLTITPVRPRRSCDAPGSRTVDVSRGFSGHHHLLVALISRPSVRANATFTVLAPPPATAVPPAPSAPVSEPMTTATSPAPPPATAPRQLRRRRRRRAAESRRTERRRRRWGQPRRPERWRRERLVDGQLMESSLGVERRAD